MPAAIDIAAAKLESVAKAMEAFETARQNDPLVRAQSAYESGGGMLHEQQKTNELLEKLRGRMDLLSTPQGQAIQQQGFASQGSAALAQVQAKVQAMSAQASYAATPQGQAQRQQMLQAQGGLRIDELQAETAASRNRTAHWNTPLGQAQAQLGRREEKNLGQAQFWEQWSKNTAEFGKVEGTARNLSMAFTAISKNPYVVAAAKGVNVIGGLWGVGMAATQAGNPMVASTYEQSYQYMMARGGRAASPAVQEASGYMQTMGDALGNSPNAMAFLKNLHYLTPFGALTGTMSRLNQNKMEHALPILPGIGHGMAQSMSYEQFAMSSGMSTMNISPLEQKTIDEQLRQINETLKEIAAQGGEGGRLGWREGPAPWNEAD